MSNLTERRQFGRRTVARHAWISVAGRPKQPCIVSNVTPDGALLEFDVPQWLPFQFKITIEGVEKPWGCEIRHATNKRVGVKFIDVASTGERSQIMESESWTGLQARKLPVKTPAARRVGIK